MILSWQHCRNHLSIRGLMSRQCDNYQIDSGVYKSETQRTRSGSLLMLQDIDTACANTGVWPHAILSGHAHNYQRFTRYLDNRETAFVVAGNGGHALQRLTGHGSPALRTPAVQTPLSNSKDKVVFETLRRYRLRLSPPDC